MTISYTWLKEWLPAAESPEITAEILTAIGLEVDGMETVEAIPGGLQGVVTAHVVTCEPHPDSDHLHITRVDAGSGQLLQVVCGAPNVAAGQKVLLATVGTVLQMNGETLKIKKSKIRGVESFGMICAEDELGIGSSHEGIMVLPEATPVGVNAKDYLQLKTETVYEIGLTPNRVDAASHLGVARDLAAYYAGMGKPLELHYPVVDAFREGTGKGVEVCVEASEAVLRYSGLTLEHVKVGPSPDWLKEKLNAVGLRPINNVVDITNYVLMDLGQPLHVFDRAKVKGDKVVVRFCAEGTPFTTLDGVARTLSDRDLMICNAEDPMCLAGVFGGRDSGVTEGTTDVFLESACFHPVFIRKSSKRHALKTDASFRYERGTDPNMVLFALRRAALLMQEICGATVVGPVADIYPHPVRNRVVPIRYRRMFDLMGKNIGEDKVNAIMEALEMKIVSLTPDGAEVSVPAYRVDVQRECDIVEDVLRIYGYNNIELPASVHASVNHTEKPDASQTLNRVANYLCGRGYREIMCNSLTKGSYYEGLATWPAEKCVRILNPLSADLNVMRQTLLLGGLEAVAYNINRQQGDLRFFETGEVYSYNMEQDTAENAQEGKSLKAYEEDKRLSILLTGQQTPQQWRIPADPANFYSLKSLVEQVFALLGARMDYLQYDPAPADMFDEGVQLSLKGKPVACFGVVGKKLLKVFDIKQAVFAAEISWTALFDLMKNNKVVYSELPKFPEVRRDLALVVDKEVGYDQLCRAARKAEKRVLRRIALFDVYTGNKLPEGKKQYALSFYLQDPEKTMTDAYVEIVMNRLLEAIKQQTGANLR